MEPLELGSAPEVAGVGYALYRIGSACIALGDPRDRGVVVYLGSESPPPRLVLACLAWISRQTESASR